MCFYLLSEFQKVVFMLFPSGDREPGNALAQFCGGFISEDISVSEKLSINVNQVYGCGIRRA